MKKGWSVSDSVYLCSKLEEIGVDCIHVSSGGNQSNPDNAPKIDDLYQVDAAKEIKKALKKTPVIAVGLIKNAVQAEYLLKNNYCDFVAFGRPILRNPNLVFESIK